MEKLNTSPQKEKTWHGRRENRAAGGKQHIQRREVDCLWSGTPLWLSHRQWVDAKGGRTWVQISPLGGVSSPSREVCKQAETTSSPRTPAWDEHLSQCRNSTRRTSRRRARGGREERNGAQSKRGDGTTAAQDGNMPLFARNVFQRMRDSDDAQTVS